ncbi:unnamed protein product, partial [Medioppia subpectinata]
PNTDILQMCDKLYVLAKGGECVYWGPPSALSPHLHTCGIEVNENQVPIETLITIASKGLSDQNVRQLRDQTTRQFNHEFRDIIVDKTKPKRFVEFGSLTALMGPSGAGKTSLLRALNGMNKTLITKQSEIYLNGEIKIRACFISQDQREHIMAGITTRQTIIYASKLKNSDTNSNVNHESIADKLMSEFSGQQKRIVIAMEMTAQIKPNLICVDEPTSGVDSYSALLMIKCFKRLSRKHNVSMIASIHQPNLEILMLFDMLYILAKEGVAVYSGPPRGLRSHLSQCNIQCNESQIPIEVLIKLSANGSSDEKVMEMSRKTNQIIEKYIERIRTELDISSDGIVIHFKHFSITEFLYLLSRAVTNFRRHEWPIILIVITFALILELLAKILFNYPLDSADSCIDISANGTDGCPQHTNGWYSVESYFMVKLLVNIIPILVTNICLSFIIDIYDRLDAMPAAIFMVITLASVAIQRICHLVSICFPRHTASAAIIICVLISITNTYFIPVYEFGPALQHLTNLSPIKVSFNYLTVYLYGRGRCPTGTHISSVLYKFQLTDEDLDKSWRLLIFQCVFYTIVSYFVLKVRVHSQSIQIKCKQLVVVGYGVGNGGNGRHTNGLLYGNCLMPITCSSGVTRAVPLSPELIEAVHCMAGFDYDRAYEVFGVQKIDIRPPPDQRLHAPRLVPRREVTEFVFEGGFDAFRLINTSEMSCNDYAIAWIDLGVKYRSLFAGNERIVLNGLSGGSELGAMTAVMGPS